MKDSLKSVSEVVMGKPKKKKQRNDGLMRYAIKH